MPDSATESYDRRGDEAIGPISRPRRTPEPTRRPAPMLAMPVPTSATDCCAFGHVVDER